MDGDGETDEVTLRVDPSQPEQCRHVLVVELSGGDVTAAPVAPLEWPGTNPKLALLADIDDQAGLEAAVAMSPANVYRPGAVFTLRDGELARTRVNRLAVPELVPFADEFPMGVDCAGEPGEIARDDRRPRRRRHGRFALGRHALVLPGGRHGLRVIRKQEFQVEVGPEAVQRWPEIRNRPFRSCPNRVS